MAGSAVPADASSDRSAQISVRPLKTPIGILQVAASAHGVVYIQLPRRRGERGIERWLRDHMSHPDVTPLLAAALGELREYFAGKRRVFSVSLDAAGTGFQRQVWARLAAIPYGETVSYGEIAADLGGRRMARAVGTAVGANPLPIVIPCHRVIGADGSLTGYSGGLRRKIWLLRHEGVLLA